MKTKLLILVSVLSLCLFASVHSYAQLTEDNLDYQSQMDGEFGPTSLDPVFLTGKVNHITQTVSGTFHFNLGIVTFWVIDEAGQLCVSEEVNAVKNGTYEINLSQQKTGKYTIICFIPGETKQVAYFKL